MPSFSLKHALKMQVDTGMGVLNGLLPTPRVLQIRSGKYRYERVVNPDEKKDPGRVPQGMRGVRGLSP